MVIQGAFNIGEPRQMNKLKDIAILFEISIPRVRQYKEYFFRKLRKLNKILQEVE